MLRPYQQNLVDQARSAFAAGKRRVLIQLPTGGGKTHILAEIAKGASDKGLTALAMAHRIEIVSQISSRLTTFGLCPSVIAASTPLSLSPTGSICAMQQTLVRRLASVPQPDLLIVDEAHHQAASGYRKITDAWPETNIVGLTATPCRLDGKPLKECFDELIIGPSVRELIGLGALADFTYLAPPVDPTLDDSLRAMRKTGGDYNKGQLEVAVNTKKIIGDVVSHYRQHFNGKPVLAFCVSVDHANEVAKAFTGAGFRAAAVDGSTKSEERDEVMESFRSGNISVLASCDLIGEGYDAPNCAGVLLLRPTASLTIFLQQCGRALRPKDDGSKAIILDHVGNCYRHGKPDDPREWSLESKVKQAQVAIRQCPACYSVIDPAISYLSCPTSAYQDTCPVVHAVASDRVREDTIEYLDGELVEYVPPVNLDWAGEIDIRSCSGNEFQRLIRMAGDDKEKLKQIAEARNFKASWVHVRIKQVQRMRNKFRSGG